MVDLGSLESRRESVWVSVGMSPVNDGRDYNFVQMEVGERGDEGRGPTFGGSGEWT